MAPHSSAQIASDPFLETNSPFESVRLKLFPGDAAKKPACKIVSRGINPLEIRDMEPVLAKALVEIREAFAKKQASVLRKFVHPRLKMSADRVAGTLDQLTATYGGLGYDISIFRVWAMNTFDGNAEPIECADDQLSLIPSFGYPLQFGVWLQARGAKELGRIYLNLVPKGKEWVIGVWHNQQWTHQGKDPDAWIDEALVAGNAGKKELAFGKLDMAAKLLNGGNYLRMQRKLDVEATRAKYGTYADWLKSVATPMVGENVGYAGTALAEDGVGILVRLIIDPNASTNQLRAKCAAAGKALYSQAWTAEFGGFQCSFVAPGEDPQHEGRLGGFFYPRTTFKS